MTHSKKSNENDFTFSFLLTNWYMGTLSEKKEKEKENLNQFCYIFWLPLIIILLCLPFFSFHFFDLNNKKKTLNIFALNRMNGYGICTRPNLKKNLFYCYVWHVVYVWMCLFWTWVVDYYHCCWLKMTRIIYHWDAVLFNISLRWFGCGWSTITI